MKEKNKTTEPTPLNKLLRIIALFEALIIIILIVIAFSTKNVFLFKVLMYIGVITAIFSISLLFLKFIHIIDTNPNPITDIADIAAAFFLLSITCVLMVSISGVPYLLDFVNSQKTAVDSLNKSIEALEDLPNFIETQTNAMNKSLGILEEIHDFLKPKPE